MTKLKEDYYFTFYPTNQCKDPISINERESTFDQSSNTLVLKYQGKDHTFTWDGQYEYFIGEINGERGYIPD